VRRAAAAVLGLGAAPVGHNLSLGLRTVHESLRRSGAQDTTPVGLRGPGLRRVLVCDAHEILHKRQVHFQATD
jgi:hypothetical protein